MTNFITIEETRALAYLYVAGHSLDEVRLAVALLGQQMIRAGSTHVEMIREIQDIVSPEDMSQVQEVSDEIAQLLKIQRDLGKVVAPIHLTFMAQLALEMTRALVPAGYTAPGYSELVDLYQLEAEALMAVA